MTATAAPAPARLGHRRVLAIALPIVMANVAVPILGAVDTGVVGQLGQAAPIGAVGIGASIITAIYWVFGFLRMGTTGLTAQAMGAGDGAEVAASLHRALLVGLVAGLAFLLLQKPLFAAALALAPASAEVERLARIYLVTRVWSAPAAIALYGVTGWLIARERSRSVLVLQLWMNGLNILLDILFVLFLGFGVAGVAAATVISEWSALLLGLWLCRDGLRGPAAALWRKVAEREPLMRMLLVNRDILIRSVLLLAAMVSFTFLGARFGDPTLAANQILLQLFYVTAYALDGFAFAAETLVGQALGRRNRAALSRAVWLVALWTAGVAVALGIGFALSGPLLIDLMTTAPEVRALARLYLPWAALIPLTGAATWLLDGIFIGATRGPDMRNMMAVSFAIYLAALALLLPPLGNHGLWLSLHIMLIARAATLALRYPRILAAADGRG